LYQCFERKAVELVSLLFFVYEKKAIKSVLYVAAILFKNGVFKMVVNAIVVAIVALVMSKKMKL